MAELRAAVLRATTGIPRLDWAVAGGLAGFAVVEVFAVPAAFPAPRVLAIAVALLATVTLAWRRRRPLEVAVVALAAVFVALIGHSISDNSDSLALAIAFTVALYSLGAYTRGRRVYAGGALVLAAVLLLLFTDRDGVSLDGFATFLFLAGGPWVAGRALQRLRSSERALARRAVHLEADREGRAQEAVAEERGRIARELHDVVAHGISVIVVQARGGRRMVEVEPDEARTAFDSIESTAAQALSEMRRLLGILRRGDDDLPLAPQPGLAHLDALAGQIREAGLPVELRVEGEARELPAGVDLSAYRIVQEALTNALKHAGPASARVIVRYGDGDVELEVADDGRGGADNHADGGHGLVGMRERVALFGGELESGVRSGGGFAVRARLPLGTERT